MVLPENGKGCQEVPQGTCEQQVRLDLGFQLMRQAVDLLEDISVQANSHLPKALLHVSTHSVSLPFPPPSTSSKPRDWRESQRS